MRITIAIPARYGSTRFPGKPLAKIGGQTMLSRVVEIAHNIAKEDRDINFFVTTDDDRIADHVAEIGAAFIMTPPECPTGSDRVLAALSQLDAMPDYVINLQGDAPFTPPKVVAALIDAIKNGNKPEVVTPVHRLSWEDLDRLRAAKAETPFSGTCAIVNKEGRALWFSKNIIPAIRKEKELRTEGTLSPVRQHIGIYGYRIDILEKFCTLPQGEYEQLEGLEQLRLIENGIPIKTVEVDILQGTIQSGIDTLEDLNRAENLLTQQSAAR